MKKLFHTAVGVCSTLLVISALLLWHPVDKSVNPEKRAAIAKAAIA